MSEISVSLLSVEKENAVPALFYNLETAKVNYFHIDVMDGKFVEKNTVEFMKQNALTISHITNVGLDVHLMVENIEEFLEEYIPLQPKIITFHYEAVSEKDRTMNLIKEIKENGIQVGMAINPETPIEVIKEFLPYIHQVLIMTVIPGKGEQKLIPETLSKIKKLKQYILENHFENIAIEADGGINETTAQSVSEAGCDILVAGSYITNSENFNDSVKKLKGEIKWKK